MKTAMIEHVVVDEANERTYIVMASKVLSDGETFKAIRQEILKRGGKRPAKGETLVVTAQEGV
jgi:hypothetical protein